jgi:structural maintenance of chromosome 4
MFPLQPGPDAFNVVPNSKLVVARQAFKNNTSRYTINGKTSNFTEVQTLLKGRSIDLDHKRFLILQVNTTPVIFAADYLTRYNPERSRIYCSDETESAHRTCLNTSRTSSERRNTKSMLRRQWSIEQLQEDRGDKLNRLRIVEKEKNALEDKKREAEDYLRLQNEHVRGSRGCGSGVCGSVY